MSGSKKPPLDQASTRATLAVARAAGIEVKWYPLRGWAILSLGERKVEFRPRTNRWRWRHWGERGSMQPASESSIGIESAIAALKESQR